MLILATNKQILSFWSRLQAERRKKANEASAASNEDEEESIPDSDELEDEVLAEICEDEFGDDEEFLETTEDRVFTAIAEELEQDED